MKNGIIFFCILLLGVLGYPAHADTIQRTLIRDHWALLGFPILPLNGQDDPYVSLQPDFGGRAPGGDTWRFSRWHSAEQQYYRLGEPEHPSGEELGDPPNLFPGFGYYLVWDYSDVGGNDTLTIDVDGWIIPWGYSTEFTLVKPPELSEGWFMIANPYMNWINWRSQVWLSVDGGDHWHSIQWGANHGYNHRYAREYHHENQYFVDNNHWMAPGSGFWFQTFTDTLLLQVNNYHGHPCAFQETVHDENGCAIRYVGEFPQPELDELDTLGNNLDWDFADWHAQFHVSYDEWTDSVCYIAVSQDTFVSDSLDSYDALKWSPRRSSYLRLQTRPDSLEQTFCIDARENTMCHGEEKSWQLEIYCYQTGDESPVPVALSWDLSDIPDSVRLSFTRENGTDLYQITDSTGSIYILADQEESWGWSKTLWITARTEVLAVESQEILPEHFACSVYPNPCNGDLRVAIDTYEAGTLSLYNLLGRRILVQEFTAGSLQTLPVHTLPSGMYILQVTTPTHQHSERVLLLR